MADRDRRAPKPVREDRAADYLPFVGAPQVAARLRVGVRPLDPARWLEVDEHRDAELALKAELLASRHADVVAHLPNTEESAREVLAAVVADLASRHGISVEPDESLHPIDAAGRLVQEDLCLHVERDGALVLAAASVCFPQEWNLRSKLGRPVRAIHSPVPGYDETIGEAVDRLLERLRPERPVWRANWSVNSDPALFQQQRHPGEPGDVSEADAGERLWLRVERQTLRRFPVYNSVLFTIRTNQRRLDELAARSDASRVYADLAIAIRALPEPMRIYKGLDAYGDALLGWLDRNSNSG